jgi:hypothetical protein
MEQGLLTKESEVKTNAKNECKITILGQFDHQEIAAIMMLLKDIENKHLDRLYAVDVKGPSSLLAAARLLLDRMAPGAIQHIVKRQGKIVEE